MYAPVDYKDLRCALCCKTEMPGPMRKEKECGHTAMNGRRGCPQRLHEALVLEPGASGHHCINMLLNIIALDCMLSKSRGHMGLVNLP